MTEQDILLILTLADTLNITRAADRLFVTQSALSKRITNLENLLNIQILIRTRQGIRFTPEGEILLQYCHRIKKEYTSLYQELESLDNDVHGSLHLGVSINYSIYELPQLLSQFKTLYPKVKVYIHSDHSRHLYDKFVKNEFDMVIVRGEFSLDTPRIKLSEEPICLIKPTQDYKIQAENYIGRRTDSAFEHALTKWLVKKNLYLSSQTIFVDNIGTCVEMVNHNLGWAIVPQICLQHFTGESTPIVFEDGTSLTRSTYAFYRENSKDLKQVQAFLGLLEEYHGTIHH